MTFLYGIFLWLKPLPLLEPSNNEHLKTNAKIRKTFLELSGRASLEYSSGKWGMSLDGPSWRRTVERGRELLHREGHKLQALGWGIGNAEERPNCLYLEGKWSKHTISAVRFWVCSTDFAWKVEINLLYAFLIKKKKNCDTYLSNHFHWRNLSKYMLFRYSWNGSPLRWSRTDLSQMKRIYKHFIILNLEQKRNKTRGENPDFLYGRIILLL